MKTSWLLSETVGLLGFTNAVLQYTYYKKKSFHTHLVLARTFIVTMTSVYHSYIEFLNKHYFVNYTYSIGQLPALRCYHWISFKVSSRPLAGRNSFSDVTMYKTMCCHQLDMHYQNPNIWTLMYISQEPHVAIGLVRIRLRLYILPDANMRYATVCRTRGNNSIQSLQLVSEWVHRTIQICKTWNTLKPLNMVALSAPRG